MSGSGVGVSYLVSDSISMIWMLQSSHLRVASFRSSMLQKRWPMHRKENCAVTSCRTCIGVNCKDGVVVAVEKTLNSPFIMDGSNKHINILSKHIGAVSSVLRVLTS